MYVCMQYIKYTYIASDTKDLYKLNLIIVT